MKRARLGLGPKVSSARLRRAVRDDGTHGEWSLTEFCDGTCDTCIADALSYYAWRARMGKRVAPRSRPASVAVRSVSKPRIFRLVVKA